MARQRDKDGSVTHERETYSWGTLRKVGNVKGSMIVHPRDHEALAKVPPGGEHTFQDETRTRWNVKRSEDGKEFHATGKRPGFAASTKIKGTWSKLAGEESGPTHEKVSRLKAFAEQAKHQQKMLQRGKKGGMFYITEGGQKSYVGKGKA